MDISPISYENMVKEVSLVDYVLLCTLDKSYKIISYFGPVVQTIAVEFTLLIVHVTLSMSIEYLVWSIGRFIPVNTTSVPPLTEPYIGSILFIYAVRLFLYETKSGILILKPPKVPSRLNLAVWVVLSHVYAEGGVILLPYTFISAN